MLINSHIITFGWIFIPILIILKKHTILEYEVKYVEIAIQKIIKT